jgi:glycopeptide antibiotics resistance protein
VTLDPSAIWQNVKQSRFTPFNSLDRYGFDLFIEKGAIFAAIGSLVSANIRHRTDRMRAATTWLLCSGLALMIETGKLLFAGRAFYSENVIIGSLGAFAGIFLLPRLFASAWVNRHRQAALFTTLVGVLVYFELSPFDWISLNELTAQFSRIEWLPFKAYYSAEPLAALFDFQQKVYLLIPFGIVVMTLRPMQVAAAPRRRALLVAIFAAVGLESLQILIRSRIPSTTDVLIFSASAWAGMALFDAYHKSSARSAHQRQIDAEGAL